MEEKKTFGRSIVILLVCIIGCLLIMSFSLPKFIDWVETPFMPQGVSCAPSIQWAIHKMLWFQIGSVILGTILGVFILFKIRK